MRDAPEFEEWALTQRTHLRDLALQAFHALTELCLTRGEYAHVTTTPHAWRSIRGAKKRIAS